MDQRVKQYGVVSPETLKSSDGLTFLKGIIAGKQPEPADQRVARLSSDRDRARPRRVRRPAGIPPLQSDRHACTAALPRRCSIRRSAARSSRRSAKGDAWTTLELKLNFVRAMSKDTGPVRAEGRIIHRGRTVATSEGDLKDAPASSTPTPRPRA